MKIDPATLSDNRRYFLLISCLIPRPIAWVSTVNDNGSYNLAPFSFFNAFSSSPPVIGLGFGPHEFKPEKDTLHNIRERGELVVNIGEEELAEKLYETSLDYPYGEDEFIRTNLTPVMGEVVKAPRVKESPISMECRLMELKKIGDGQNTLVLAEVVMLHIRETLLDNRGAVDPHRFKPLARLGAGRFAGLGNIINLPKKD